MSEGPPRRHASEEVPGGRAAGVPAFRIRDMRAVDLAQVVEIESDCFATPWSARTFLNLLRRPNAALYVAENNLGDVLGYAVAWFSGPECELGDLAVRPDRRRGGIGLALVRAILDEARARGAHEVFLEVRESNEGARKLYERVGFEASGRRPRYYTDPVEDAVIMRRTPAR